MSGEDSTDEIAESKKYIEESDRVQVNDDILVDNEIKRFKYPLSETVNLIEEDLNSGVINMSINEDENEINITIDTMGKFQEELSARKTESKKVVYEIGNLQTKSKALKKELQSLTIETRNALEDYDEITNCYLNAFAYTVEVVNCLNGRCNIVSAFKESPFQTITFDMDENTMTLIDFDASSFCTEEEEKLLKDNYKENFDLQSLFCDLKEILLSKLTEDSN